jgi:hypothetical protein
MRPPNTTAAAAQQDSEQSQELPQIWPPMPDPSPGQLAVQAWGPQVIRVP